MKILKTFERDEFLRRKKDVGCRALSACYTPKDPKGREIQCTVCELLSGNTYSCRAANADRTSFEEYNSPKACPTLFRDLVASPTLLDKLMEENKQYKDNILTCAELVSLHCQGCDKRIIVDGVHRLARLVNDDKMNASLKIIELSAESWGPDTPDFNLVCTCNRSAH